jgi:hypothetical protein
MPFGCAALILLPTDQRVKFQSRCALVIFVHYAENHPHETYAFYSPATKRILYRQDCVFLVDVFPMRDALRATGLSTDGDILVPYKCRRPPKSILQNAPSEFSFGDWKAPVLPRFDDHITGHLPHNDDDSPITDDLDILSSSPLKDSSSQSTALLDPPNHPAFGPPSVVPVVPPLVISPPIVELSSVSPSPPPSNAPDLDEDQAFALVGERFFDEEFGWCTVTGFGTEAGTLINFYTPEVTGAAEEWSTFSEVSNWVFQAKTSRQEKRSFSRRIRQKSSRIKKTRKALFTVPLPSIPTASLCDLAPISPRLMRRILRFNVSIFKYGVQIPRNEKEADNSPERHRWKAGRDLEWLRLGERGTFGKSFTWDQIQELHPQYQKSDIGKTFFVYDFKHSGEHRVRLVFDGSRQTEATYSETFAPTVRADSIRLFHLFCVEMGYDIKQYDVPQAFLQSEIDHLIFVYPPRGYAKVPSEILQLRLGLYGAKQSAAIWANTLNTFLLTLGFESSDLDPCFYRRVEPTGELTLLISYVDDFRIGGTDTAIKEVYQAMFAAWGITSCDGTRFLGLDVSYDRPDGRLKFSMSTYIQQTIERFAMADLTKGLPYRNLIGCLMWLACSVFGTVLVQVKELARFSNSYTEKEYKAALSLLHSLDPTKGIVFLRGGAYHERIPQLTRQGGGNGGGKGGEPSIPSKHCGSLLAQKGENKGVAKGGDSDAEEMHTLEDSPFTGFSLQAPDIINEFGEKDLYRVIDEIKRKEHQKDKKKTIIRTRRFRITAYTDAAFAVNELKQSVSGWIVYLNGTPILFGSLRQTVVVDSSCSAEYVAASVCVKKIMELEHMLAFLDIHCEKPYRMYTDSMACKYIACNNSRMGKVRHLAIRTHLTRCHISLGDIELVWCTTESMNADVMTKEVSSAQDKRLSDRFYNDVGDREEVSTNTATSGSTSFGSSEGSSSVDE